MSTETSTSTLRNDDIVNDHLQSVVCNLEGITLVWYDANLDVALREKLRINQEDMRSINNFVIFCETEHKCIDTIRSIKNEKIVLVTSGSGAESLLSFDNKFVHGVVQAILIFCRTKEKYEPLRKSYLKIISIYNDPKELKQAIKEEVDLLQAHLETFNFYNRNEEKSMCDLSKRPATLHWLLVFKDFVVRLPKDEKAKSEMIKTCTDYYRGNKNELKRIQDFRKTYKPEHAISWYTRTSFVYKLVNKALRTEDIEQLYIFRFYISDLCNQIASAHKQNSQQHSLILYRGVRLPLEEIKRWKENEGKLISTNGYLSTSLSREEAKEFALRRTETNMEESVLIEIECDQSSVPFAIVGKESHFSKEEEVLFDLGATFEILSVTNSREENDKFDIWIVKVKSAIVKTRDLPQECIQQTFELFGNNEILLWASFFWSMGDTSKSLKFFHKLAENQCSAISSESIFRVMLECVNKYEDYDETLKYLEHEQKNSESSSIVNLGPVYSWKKSFVYKQKGTYDQALSELKWLLRPVEEITVEDDAWNTWKVSFYMSLGDIYLSKGQYNEAIDNSKKANDIAEKYCPPDHIFFSTYLERRADICYEMGDLHGALEHYQKLTEIRVKYHPLQKSRIIYRMGSIHDSLANYEQCLEYYHQAAIVAKERAIEIREEFAVYFEVTGRSEWLHGNLETALDCFEQASVIRQQIFGPKHDFVARAYYSKGTLLEELKRDDEALSNYQAALAILREVFPDGHRSLALTLSRLGDQHRRQRKFKQAEKFCNEAISMQEKLLPSNHIDSSFTLSCLGRIFSDQGNYNESEKYLLKALKIQNIFSNGSPHRYQTSTLISLSDVYKNLKNFRLALECLRKALTIEEKSFSQQYSKVTELQGKIHELTNLITL